MTPELDHTLLEQYTPFIELNASLLDRLANKANLFSLSKGKQIAANQVIRWFVFLRRGKLKLQLASGKTAELTPEQPLASEPLFARAGAALRIKAMTDSELLLVDRQLYELLREEQTSSGGGYRVQDLDITDNEGELFRLVFAALESSRLELPSLPEVAKRVHELAGRDDTSLDDIARVIQTDPSVAGRFLQVANSPVYRGVEPVNSISQAVMRLGLKTTRSLVMSLAMEQVFHSRVGVLRQRMQRLWQHGVGVAAHAFALARRLPDLDAERAQFAGLIHNIGAVPIIAYAEGLEQLHDSAQLDQAIRRLGPFVGVMVLTEWALDSDFVTVVEHAGNWYRDTGQSADYCDIVITAQLHIRQGEPALPAPGEVPACRKLELGPLDENARLTAISEAEAEIQAVQALLRGEAG